MKTWPNEADQTGSAAQLRITINEQEQKSRETQRAMRAGEH